MSLSSQGALSWRPTRQCTAMLPPKSSCARRAPCQASLAPGATALELQESHNILSFVHLRQHADERRSPFLDARGNLWSAPIYRATTQLQTPPAPSPSLHGKTGHSRKRGSLSASSAENASSLSPPCSASALLTKTTTTFAATRRKLHSTSSSTAPSPPPSGSPSASTPPAPQRPPRGAAHYDCFIILCCWRTCGNTAMCACSTQSRAFSRAPSKSLQRCSGSMALSATGLRPSCSRLLAPFTILCSVIPYVTTKARP